MAIRINAVFPLFVLSCCVFAYGQAPELILVNGKIFTSNTRQPYAQALAIQGERIVAVGTTEQIKRLAGKDAKIVDLGGRTVIPGINDEHKHLFIAPQNSVEVDFKSFDPSWADAKRLVVATLANAPKGSFIYGDIGPKIFHDVTVDRTALDELSRDHPVILTTFAGHAGIDRARVRKWLWWGSWSWLSGFPEPDRRHFDVTITPMILSFIASTSPRLLYRRSGKQFESD